MKKGSATTILLVDDNVASRRMVRTTLTHMGFPLVEETTGANALDRLREKTFDLIIADAELAPVTGFDLLRQVRTEGALKHIPFIMMASPNPESITAAKAAGVMHYLLKPISAAALTARIASIVGA